MLMDGGFPYPTGTAQGVFIPPQTKSNVLCCLCGTSISPNPTSMCIACIRSQVDITEGIQKQVTVLWCKQCERYLQPPKHWVRAALESKELLTFCLKRIKGLSKVKLVDAGFLWTEPHSRRIKLQLKVQAPVLNGAILEQTFVVEFVVETQMCLECTRAAGTNTNVWTACAQVRQHVEHKRTFFYLEQVILKHGAAHSCINIKDVHQGIDFYFSSKSHAVKFLDFLQAVVPIHYRQDKQLVSHNIHTSTYNYKYTYSVEIAPTCRDDLLCLAPKVAAQMGGLGPLVLCTRVTNVVTLTDPLTLRQAHLDSIEAAAFLAGQYWRLQPKTIMNSRQLVEYVVLDTEPMGPSTSRFQLAVVQLAKTSDLGQNDRVVSVVTHLGHLLHPGDRALGYDTGNANLVGMDLEQALDKGLQVPDVILVRKSYEEKRKRRRERGERRPWKLQRMAVDQGDVVMKSKAERAEALRAEADLEHFMEELEEDPELRAKVALYRDPDYDAAAAAAARENAMTDDDDEDDGLLDVPLEELLDDLAALSVQDNADPDQGRGQALHPGAPPG